MSGCLKVLTMHKVSKVLLEIASIGWVVFVIVAIVMTLSSCSFESKASEDVSMYSNQCENCDEVD